MRRAAAGSARCSIWAGCGRRRSRVPPWGRFFLPTRRRGHRALVAGGDRQGQQDPAGARHRRAGCRTGPLSRANGLPPTPQFGETRRQVLPVIGREAGRDKALSRRALHLVLKRRCLVWRPGACRRAGPSGRRRPQCWPVPRRTKSAQLFALNVSAQNCTSRLRRAMKPLADPCTRAGQKPVHAS